MKLSQVCSYVAGELIRDGEFEMLEQCTAICDKAFLTYLENPRFANRIADNATCIICRKDMVSDIEAQFCEMGILAVAEPRKSFFEIHNRLIDKEKFSFPTQIGENCKIGSTAIIANEGVIIGNNTVIEEFVQVNRGTVIGDNCIIHSHVVIAGKSYTFVKTLDECLMGVDDGGSVDIGNNVEIFPFVNIAIGVLDSDVTRIGDGTKIDALVHIGHGAIIGKNCKIIAGTQIGGNTVVGDGSTLGINSTISNRLTLGKKANVSLGAVVTKDVSENSKVSGNFAINHEVFLQNFKKSIE